MELTQEQNTRNFTTKKQKKLVISILLIAYSRAFDRVRKKFPKEKYRNDLSKTIDKYSWSCVRHSYDLKKMMLILDNSTSQIIPLGDRFKDH